jgi:hypothetical protein
MTGILGNKIYNKLSYSTTIAIQHLNNVNFDKKCQKRTLLNPTGIDNGCKELYKCCSV